VSDLHLGGAVMWIGGDAIMFGLMMLVYMMWSLDDRAATSSHGWLESARRASLARLIAEHPAPAGGGTAAGSGTVGASGAAAESAAATRWDQRGGIDDDEHLAAYNAFLARLNEAESSRKHR
jgi:putative copper resistance protein D